MSQSGEGGTCYAGAKDHGKSLKERRTIEVNVGFCPVDTQDFFLKKGGQRTFLGQMCGDLGRTVWEPISAHLLLVSVQDTRQAVRGNQCDSGPVLYLPTLRTESWRTRARNTESVAFPWNLNWGDRLLCAPTSERT